MRLGRGIGAGAGLVSGMFILVVALAATYVGQVQASAGVMLSAAVPARYRAMLEQAAKQCPQLPVPLFAAQIQAESAFNPNVVSGVGAMGIAQFMPGTWRQLGRDANGNGRASAFEPADAFDAQVRFMCDLHRTAKASGLRGDPVSLALAGYNAGWGAVRKYSGIPPYRETRGYVARILRMTSQFTATAASAAASAVGGVAGTVTNAVLGKAADILPGGLSLPRVNPRTTAQAIAWAQSRRGGPAIWYNRCLNFVAQTYGWHNSGVNYAIDHFSVAPAPLRHPGDRNPPPGALLFWNTGHRAGHVALSVGNGLIASNDIESRGRISIVPMDAPERRWGARYVGWTAPYFPHAG